MRSGRKAPTFRAKLLSSEVKMQAAGSVVMSLPLYMITLRLISEDSNFLDILHIGHVVLILRKNDLNSVCISVQDIIIYHISGPCNKSC
jgi:hypothetical protein